MQPFGGPLDLDTSPLGPPIQMPAPKPKGGMFGSGKGAKIGEAISAAIGGWLMGGGNPAGANILAMLQQRRQSKERAAQEEQQYQQHRQDALSDWMEQQKFKLANPGPTNNDTVADYDFITQQLGPDAAKEFLRNKTIAPPMMVPGPNGQMFMVPRSMPQQSGPQAGHVEDGFQFMGGDPSDKNNWKQVGGAGPQAPRPFP